MVHFKIRWLISLEKFELPNNKVSIKSFSLRKSKLGSIVFNSSRRVVLNVEKCWQRRKKCLVSSVSRLQVHKGLTVSWKLWRNLCSRRWLRPKRILDNNFTPKGSWIPYKLFGHGLIFFNKCLRKIEKEVTLRISGSTLFHSLIEYGKNESQ